MIVFWCVLNMATNTTYALNVGLPVIGVSIETDFHALPLSAASELSALADYCGYKRPKNANGSKARYFWAYLQRVNKRKGV